MFLFSICCTNAISESGNQSSILKCPDNFPPINDSTMPSISAQKNMVEIYEKSLGIEHPALSDLLTNIAYDYMHNEKYNDANILFERVMRIDEKHRSTDYYILMLDKINLAISDCYINKFSEAKTIDQDIINYGYKAMHKGMTDNMNFHLLMENACYLHNMSNCYKKNGKNAEAQEYEEKSNKMINAIKLNISDRESPRQQAQPVNQQKVYKIGLLCSLTGPFATLGSEQLRTISDHVNQINSQGGISGHLLYIFGTSQAKPFPTQYSELRGGSGYIFNNKGRLTGAYSSGKYVEFTDSLVCDTRYEGDDKSRVAQCVDQLVQSDVAAIIGPTTSPETLQIIPLIQNAKVPLISFGVNPAITNPPRDWVFSAKPIEAVLAIADALWSAGYDRNSIRQYLETRLPRAKR